MANIRDEFQGMYRLVWLFWNRRERRLRAGWRVLIQLGFWIFTPILLNMAVGSPLTLVVSDLFPDLATISERITLFALTLVAVLLSTWFVVRFIDHRPLTDLGLRLDAAWWLDLLFGLALGAALMTFIFGFEWFAGWIVVSEIFAVNMPGMSFAVTIVGPIVIFIVVGITEEILSRGYQLRNLAEGLNFPALGAKGAIIIAWFISSSLFGLLHVFNPNSTWLSTSYLMLAGLFLGLGLVLTGRLGLPIGLHITWNFFQGNVFGFPVSGNDFTSATFIAIEQQGPVLWTGGAFGPEAGLIGILAILIGCGCILVWVRFRYGIIRLYEPLACYTPRERSEVIEYGE